MALTKKERERQLWHREQLRKQEAMRQRELKQRAANNRAAKDKATAAERTRLQRLAETQRIWGGGAAADKKLKNNMAYLDNKTKQSAKPGAKPTDYKSRFAGARDAAHAKARKIEPTAPKATPKPSATNRSSGGGGGGYSAAKVSSSGGGGGGAKSAVHTYKEHGSDLHVGRYKTLAEHRAAVEKAKGGSSAADKPSSGGRVPAAIKNSRQSNDIGGAGAGDTNGGRVPANIKNSRSANDIGGAGGPQKKSEPQVGYKVKTKVDGSKYNGGKAATNRTGDKNPDISSKATNKYLEEIEKRRKGQSNVIG